MRQLVRPRKHGFVTAPALRLPDDQYKTSNSTELGDELFPKKRYQYRKEPEYLKSFPPRELITEITYLQPVSSKQDKLAIRSSHKAYSLRDRTYQLLINILD